MAHGSSYLGRLLTYFSFARDFRREVSWVLSFPARAPYQIRTGHICLEGKDVTATPMVHIGKRAKISSQRVALPKERGVKPQTSHRRGRPDHMFFALNTLFSVGKDIIVGPPHSVGLLLPIGSFQTCWSWQGIFCHSFGTQASRIAPRSCSLNTIQSSPSPIRTETRGVSHAYAFRERCCAIQLRGYKNRVVSRHNP